MTPDRRVAYPGVQVFDKNGNPITLQISKGGGSVILANGRLDTEGFYVCLDSAAVEGNLKVILYSDDTDTPVVLPFFKNWNPILIKKIVGNDAANTATNVYWGK